MSTFTRINAVTVFGGAGSIDETDTGVYIDATLLPGGANNAAVIQLPFAGVVASSGQLYRGMPAYTLPSSGKLCAPNASGAVFRGVLLNDITSRIVSLGTKVTFQKAGRVRTYAGATLAYGQAVKPDTSSDFKGFIPYVAGTDDVETYAGHAYPLDDGSTSNGASAATAMAAGDTIFLDLKLR